MREYSAWEGGVYLLHKKEANCGSDDEFVKIGTYFIKHEGFWRKKRVETYIHLAIVDLKIHTNTHI